MRQLLAEGVVLALTGALGAFVFAYWAGRAVVAALSTIDARISLDLSYDWRVVTVTVVVALLTAVLFGTGPAFAASRAQPIEALRQNRGGSSRGTLSMPLVAAQIAVSVVLLVCAALLLSTFQRLAAVPLGFDSEPILVVQVDTARAHGDPSTRMDYFARLVDAVRAVPGVARAAGSTITPFSEATKSAMFSQPGRARQHSVSPGFFDTYGIGLRAGRDFKDGDAAKTTRVVVVSEGYARHFLDNPLGATIDTGPCESRAGSCTVVGVVDDVVFGAPRGGARPTLYFPLAQSAGMGPPGQTTVSLSIRPATGSPGLLSRSVANTLMHVDRRLAFSFRRLDEDVRATFTQERLVAAVSGFLATLALLLSALGLYGLTSYNVARRRTEIGIRVALGATPSRIVALIVSRFLVIVAAGILGGGVMALWASSLISSLLHGVGPRDPATLAAAAVLLGSVVAASSITGAFRAARIDAAEVLRHT
jgi:predicted permease